MFKKIHFTLILHIVSAHVLVHGGFCDFSTAVDLGLSAAYGLGLPDLPA